MLYITELYSLLCVACSH